MKLRATFLVCAMALPASMLLARVHPFGDAGLYTPAQPAHPSSIPPQANAILTAKCADCHSDNARTPLYGRFAPVSWLLERDIIEGRKHLDLTAWDTYSSDRQQTLQSLILKETKSDEMPLPQYRVIHRDSAITAAEIQVLSAWAHTSASPDEEVGLTEGNAVAGRAVFEKRCAGCHTLDQSHEGPRLRGVFGKPAAQVAGFDYSAALKNSHVVWDEASLDKWLTDPDTFVPGNNMSFGVPKLQEREDLIRFLRESQ
jgi:cytochrome c